MIKNSHQYVKNYQKTSKYVKIGLKYVKYPPKPSIIREKRKKTGKNLKLAQKQSKSVKSI